MPRKQITWIKQKAPYEGLSDCMICTSHRSNNYGYPQITANGKVTSISRLVCQRFNPDMGELHSLHSCDNRSCINPDHIRPGTRLENLADKSARGRAAKGEGLPQSKLTEEQALQIYNSTESFRETAKSFGVALSTVYYIKIRRNWKHIHASI